MEEFYYEIYENIPRQGPGDSIFTRKAFSHLNNLPLNPRVLDIGCGKGIQTIELAHLTGGSISAVDNHQFFLDCLEINANQQKVDNKITCVCADMNCLPFKVETFDLIWSEGAIFIVGIKEGLKNWKKFIKKNGYIVFSDLVWKKEPETSELKDYWNNEYPNILYINEVINEGQKLGFEVITHFSLPKKSWLDYYLVPIENTITRLKLKNYQNHEAMEVYKTCEKENEIVRQFYGTFVYEYFILKLI